MKKITKIASEAGAKLRDRSRSVKLRALEIARAARAKGKQSQGKLERAYGKLLNSTSRVVGQAKRFSKEIAEGVKRAPSVLKQLALEGLRQELDAMVPRVKQVMKQTRARIFRGDTRAEGKLLSLFEPSTEIIRKGKAGKPNEFGKMVKLQEAENQIVIDYEVYAQRPSDSDLLIAAIETHQAMLGRTPRLVAADAAFYSARNEATRAQPLPIQGRRRNGALGRARRGRRQPHQHRPRNGKTIRPIGPDVQPKLPPIRRPSTAGFPLRRVIDHSPGNVNFAPESSYVNAYVGRGDAHRLKGD